MSKKLASLKIKIDANGAQAVKELKTVEKKVQDIAKRMKSIGSAMSKYVTGPLVALAAVSVKTANTQLQAEAKLRNALKGREDVQKRLMAQASEIQSRSLFGDEEIINQQAIVAAMGLTEQQIIDLTEAAVQLSAATGMSLDSAFKNLAKTYSGLAGELGESIPALRELTKEQLANGEAIKLINGQYQGFAEQAASTGAGSLVQLKNKFGDLTEQIGIILLPALERLVRALTNLVEWFSSLSKGTQTCLVVIGGIAAVVGPALVALAQMITAVQTLNGWLIALKGSIAGAGTGVPALATSLKSVLLPALAAVAAYAYSVYKLFDSLAEKATEANMQRNKGAYDETYAKFSNPRVTDAMINNALNSRNKDIAYWEERKANESARDFGLAGGDTMLAKLYGERDALIAVTKARKEATKAAKDAADQQKFLNDLQNAGAAAAANATAGIGNVNAGIEEGDGLIGKLQKDIKELEATLPFLKTTDEIAQANAQLAEMRKRLEQLQNLKPTSASGPVITTKGKPVFSMPGPKFEYNENGGLSFGKFSEMWAEFIKRMEQAKNEAKKVNEEISSIFSSTAQNLATGIGEMLGNAMSGEEGAWAEGGRNILRILGQSIKELGAALIKYAVIVEGFKKAIKDIFKGPAGIAAAIALGIGAIAAGQALINKASQPPKLAKGGLAYGPTLAVVGDNPGATNDPEVIAPLSKLRSYMGGQRLQLTGDVSFELSGDKLRATLNRENVRLATLG